MVKVKICGITNMEDLRAASDAGADLLGFVVGAPSSPRNLTLSKARCLISNVPEGVSSVAVTVFKTVDELVQIYRELNADCLQLHGAFSHTLEPKADTLPRSRIIRAVDGGAPDALERAVEFSDVFQSVLLDTAGSGGVGGTGITLDWYSSRRIRDAIHPAPLILAGGLTPENVGEAIQRVKPYGVDVSSGVERKAGMKDHEKIRDFIAKVRRARS